MAIVLTKKPQTAAPAPQETVAGVPDDVVNLLNELAALQPNAIKAILAIKQLTIALEPYKTKMKALTDLVSPLEGKEADKPFTLDTELVTAVCSKRYKVRTVKDVKQAVALLNKAKKNLAWEIITVPLGKIDQFLTPAEKELVLDVADGERTIQLTVKKRVNKAA